MSCFFDSLSYFFNADSSALRNEICNYLDSNSPIMEDIETKTILDIIHPDYVNVMRNQNTWAGGVEISAACNIWNISIAVHSHQEKPIIFEPLNKNHKYMVNLFWTGNHYQPLRI